MTASATYNPRTLDPQTIVARFVARRALLERILSELRRAAPQTPPPHQLVVGQRGMGKTMLLARLGVGIDEDPGLSARWMSLGFPEEQYNVSQLSDLWVNCLDALADRLERQGARAAVEELDSAIDVLRGATEARRRQEALELLRAQSSRLGRGFVLLLDNVDLVLDRLGDDEWALREVLSEQPWLMVVGATSRPLEATYTYEAAFYDFFQVHMLRGLSAAEAHDVLVALDRKSVV